jgi:hypothetical protein
MYFSLDDLSGQWISDEPGYTVTAGKAAYTR